MALPELIEIVPLSGPVEAELTVPGSKSITNRALLLAALTEGETRLEGALWSEDTQIMVECLRDLGFMVNVEMDPVEPGNRTVIVYGKAGIVPRGGTRDQPLDLFVGNAGTAARFLAAFVCLGSGVYRLQGVARMHERPQAALFQALRQLGYTVESANDRLPALVHGGGPRRGTCRVSIAESSQFASALLLGSLAGGWSVEIEGQNAEESPYVELTRKLLTTFPRAGGRLQIEPDASSGSYFWAAGALLKGLKRLEARTETAPPCPATGITVAHWPHSGWQIDERFAQALVLESDTAAKPSNEISRERDLGDSIMTAIVLAPFASEAIRFTDLGRLRLQECERVAALRAELIKCGAKVEEQGDTLTVYPSALRGTEVETYNDHRMAMCFTILGLKVSGMRIKNPACVKKTFPNFFQKLAAPPPHGLGATIREARSGRGLAADELFAD